MKHSLKFKIGDRVRMTEEVSGEFTRIPAVVVKGRSCDWLTISFDRDPGFGWAYGSYMWCWNVPVECIEPGRIQGELFDV